MSDISRQEMGLIIGLVIGTLFLVLLAVLAYIFYDKQKDKMYGIFHITTPQQQPRTGPSGGGHTWTTINNSMVGLEVEDQNQHHLHHEGAEMEPNPAQQTSEDGGPAPGHRKGMLTVLFGWDIDKHPLPKPFRQLTNRLWEHASGDWEPPWAASSDCAPQMPVAAGAGAKLWRKLRSVQARRTQATPQGSADDTECGQPAALSSPQQSPLPRLAWETPLLTGDVNPSDTVAVATAVRVLVPQGCGRKGCGRKAAKGPDQFGCCGLAERLHVGSSRADIRCLVAVAVNPVAVEEVLKPAVPRTPTATAAPTALTPTPVVLPSGFVV